MGDNRLLREKEVLDERNSRSYWSPIGDFGGSAGYFSTTGNSDSLLYAPNPVDGSRTGKPNSDGFILELDYLPLREKRTFFSPKRSLLLLRRSDVAPIKEES